MLDQATRSKIVKDLTESYLTRKGLPLISKAYPQIELEDSYRIQEEFVAARVSAGARIKGYKVGLTSKAMQEMSGATEPDFSSMTDDLFVSEGTPLPMSRFFDPMVEMEIAFVLKESLLAGRRIADGCHSCHRLRRTSY